jgi:radical SAM superfamily enzyme YgiQ (UPF0313 family)
MKILLINPPYYTGKDYDPHLGLGYISSVLKNNDFKNIHYLEGSFLGLDKTQKEIERIKPDVVCISAQTIKAYNSYKIVNFCKNTLDCLTILGGVHPTLLSNECFEKSKVDIVVRGEGEYTLLDIINGKSLKNILGISYHKRNRVFHNANRPLIKNLDELPFPDRDLFPMKLFFNLSKKSMVFPYPNFSMITSRGCPFKCAFCNSQKFWKNTIRFRSAENVVDEIEFLINKYKIRNFRIWDDTFTLNKKRLLEICRLIKERKLDINYTCFSRVDTIDKNILKSLTESGCSLIDFGIESGNQRILNLMRKNITLYQIKKTVDLVKKFRINTIGNFIIGNYGDTPSTINETINYAKKLNLFFNIFNILVPFPKTEIYHQLKTENKIISEDWNNYDLKLQNKPTWTAEYDLKYWLNRADFKTSFRWGFVKKYFKKFFTDYKLISFMMFAFYMNKTLFDYLNACLKYKNFSSK